jgi:beta-glucanase (GH16 family)
VLVAALALVAAGCGARAKPTDPTPAPSYSLAGTITPAATGSADTLQLTGTASALALTNGVGQYQFPQLAPGGYAVTPRHAGRVFTPASRPATVAGANVTGIDFAANAFTHAISGTILPAASGAGATVVLGGAASASTTADASGAYAFAGRADGSYTVTPSKCAFGFSPSQRAVTLSGADVATVDFAAAPATYSISGTIAPAGLGSGDTITLSGAASATTTANGSGGYSFAGLSNGSYTVTPARTGATFSPASRAATLNCASVTGQDFTASAPGTTIYFDDFTGATLGSSWVALDRHGDYSNAEVACYTPANVSVTGGNLEILSRVEAKTCGDAVHAAASWNYTSGMVQWSAFKFTYGTVEIRAKMAGGQGTWPALWLLGSDCQASNVGSADNTGTCNWPQPGSDEIDITEIKLGALTTVHQNVISGSSTFYSCTPTTSDVSANWHVYQLVWTPTSLVWKIDGATTCTKSSPGVPIPSHPMFLMINTAIGGQGGTIVNSTFPQTLTVDYVKLTQP